MKQKKAIINRRIFWLTVLLLLGQIYSSPIYAQRGKISENTRFQKGIRLGLGYNHSLLLNDRFVEYKQDGVIKHRWGSIINLRVVFNPIILDLSNFSSSYKVDSPVWSFDDTTYVRHRGLELAVSMNLLPRSKYFLPYIGIGLQTSALGVNIGIWDKLTAEDSDELEVSSISMSGPIWKVGLLINFSQSIGINAEYKHRLPGKGTSVDLQAQHLSFTEHNKSFHQFSFWLFMNLSVIYQ